MCIVAQQDPSELLGDSDSEDLYESASEQVEDPGQVSDTEQEPERLVDHQEAPEAHSSGEDVLLSDARFRRAEKRRHQLQRRSHRQ